MASIPALVSVPDYYSSLVSVPGHYSSLVSVPGHYSSLVSVPGHYSSLVSIPDNCSSLISIPDPYTSFILVSFPRHASYMYIAEIQSLVLAETPECGYGLLALAIAFISLHKCLNCATFLQLRKVIASLEEKYM